MKRDFLKIGVSILSFVTLLSCNGETRNVEPEESDNYRSYYQIFVGAFADSNGDGVGDLKGIEDKLDYIVDMGYRGIWLSPIFESPSYHKYNTTDYFAIDDELGTMADLTSLVAKAHENNVKVILDLALNHSSRSNELFKKAVAARAYTLNEATDSEKSLLGGMSQEDIEAYGELYSFSETNMTYTRVSGHSFYVESNFDSDMPEFNFDSSLAWDTFYSIIDYYMNDIGVDGFRLDAVKYYYLGNDEKNYTALDKIIDRVRQNDPNGYVVSENWSSEYVIDAYYENTKMDSYFYFPGNGSTGFINKIFNRVGARNLFYNGQVDMIEESHGHIPAPFMSNHDTGRLSKSELGPAKFLNGCFATLTGNTFSYYGDEVGMSQGASDDPSKRTHMYWGDSYDCNDFATSTPSTYNFGSVKSQIDNPKSLVNYVKKAMNLRLAYPVIGHGDVVGSSDLYEEDDMLLSIDKKYGEEEMRIVYNFSSSASYSYSDDTYKTKLAELTTDNSTIEKKDDKFNMKPYSILFLGK